MARKNILRKCQHCDEVGEKTIDIENDKFVAEKTGNSKSFKYWHFDCYVKKIMKNKNININEATEIATGIYEKEKEKIMAKDKFYSWLMEYHKTTYLSSFVYIRVDEIVSGVYKSLKEPISYEDLRTMYEKQSSKLDGIAISKARKGNGFKDASSRVLYDLAILASKYDSFKQWKIKQRLLALEIQNTKTDEKNNLTKIPNNVNIGKKKRDKNKLEDVGIDELF